MIHGIQAWLSGAPSRRYLVAAGLAVCIFAAGVGAGSRFLARPSVKTVTDKQVVLTELSHAVVVEKPVDRWRTRNTVITKYDCPGGKVSETITSGSTGGEHTGGSTTTTGEKLAETDKEHATVVSTPVADLRFQLDAMLGVQPFRAASIVAGVSASYRLIGPLTFGGWVTVPVTDLAGTAVGVSIGVRLP